MDRNTKVKERMDIFKMLAELRSERDKIEEAILVVERIARAGGKRRGRPPKWMSLANERTATARRKRAVSAAAGMGSKG